ncbi:MAG: hypothetical protein BWZ07_03165 [Alphaproteobacteria bacterium ADurb.BinA280]|nr:MAG: hypothetical protein BWZ07_03165 [Alphaproteobacteria bacterium ADurb.BinA280]
MPDTKHAVEWALEQTVTDMYGVTYAVSRDTPMELVGKVREYFNAHGIAYGTFGYSDLLPFFD